MGNIFLFWRIGKMGNRELGDGRFERPMRVQEGEELVVKFNLSSERQEQMKKYTYNVTIELVDEGVKTITTLQTTTELEPCHDGLITHFHVEAAKKNKVRFKETLRVIGFEEIELPAFTNTVEFVVNRIITMTDKERELLFCKIGRRESFVTFRVDWRQEALDQHIANAYSTR